MPALLRTCLSSFFSGIGKTRIVLFATFITMLLNIFFNYCLIFGHLGLPALGLKGAAYGTLASSSCGLLILLFAYFNRHNRNSYRISESFHLDFELLKKLLRYGSPSGLEMFLNLLAFNIVILIFHSDGPVTATAVTIVFNWDLVSFVPLLGIQVGVVSLVGRYMGAGQVETAARATMSALKMAFGYSLLILILFASIPDLLVNVFKPDDVGPPLRLRLSAGRHHAAPGCILRTCGRDHGCFQRCAARCRGYLLDHADLGLHALVADSAAADLAKNPEPESAERMDSADLRLYDFQRHLLSALP